MRAALFLVVVLGVACESQLAPQLVSPTGRVVKAPCPFIQEDVVDFRNATTGSSELKLLHLVNPTSFSLLGLLESSQPNVFQVEQATSVGPFGVASFSAFFSPPDARSWSATLTLRGMGRCADQLVSLTGRLKADVTAPRELAFPPVAVGQSLTLELPITSLLDGPQDVTFTTSFDPGTEFSVPSRLHLEAGQTVSVPVRFTAAFDGRVDGQLFVHGPSNIEQVVLRAMGGIPRVSLSTQHISLESFIPSETSTVVFVRNAGGGVAELTLDSVQRTSGDAALRVEVLDQQVFFSIAPLQPGPSTWQVTFKTNDPSTPTLTVDVSTVASPDPGCFNLAVSPTFVQLDFDGGVMTTELHLTTASNLPCRATLFFINDVPGWSLSPAQPVVSRDGGVVTLTITTPGDVQVQAQSAGSGASVLVSVQ